MSHLVQDLVAARKARGITQEELAEAMGVTQATVSEFEASDDPRLSTVRRYASVVGVKLHHEVVEEPLMSATLASILARLLTDDEREYTLYRTRSTQPTHYGTFALSAFANLTKSEYELLREILGNQEEE